MFCTKPGEVRALIEDWIGRPALRKLVEAYGGSWPTGGLDAVVPQLLEFSQIWDYRAGNRDRHMFHDDVADSDPFAELTYSAAEELGMVNPPRPSRTQYDYLLVLGGLATGVEPRVQYAAELLEGGMGVHRQIAALGSFRPLQDRELPLSRKFAPDGRYEVDHLRAMLDSLFRSTNGWSETRQGDPDEQPSLAGLIARKERSDQPDLGVYAAPSSDPSVRPANTADTYVLFAETNSLVPCQRLLIVTSAIYLPYQHLEAVRVLRPYELEIETVGVRRSSQGAPHKASAYRQEIRSAIRSISLNLPEADRPHYR